MYEGGVEIARVRLGEETFTVAFAEGRALFMDEAIALALH